MAASERQKGRKRRGGSRVHLTEDECKEVGVVSWWTVKERVKRDSKFLEEENSPKELFNR